MSWPLSQDYNEAVQNPRSSFSDAELRDAEAVSNAMGIPIPRSGNFADVYEFRSASGGHWAVKCFTREMAGLRERYAAISRYLHEAHLPFAVDFTFLEQGLRIGGQWYPILKMQWVEGLTLNEFVREYADKPAKLEALLQIWVRMAARLRGAGIAHADLQHGNVLLVPGSTANSLAVKLVDYDGMFVPALVGGDSGEVGHPCYQHPQRLAERTYSLEVDRFPLLLVATALDCLKVGGRAMWEKYDSGDNLLFREADLQAPVKSPLFYEMLKLTDERALRLVRHTLDALKGRLESVPLLEEVLPELHAPAAPKPAAVPATPKRTTVVKGAVAEATAVMPAINTAWDFEGEDKSRSRRRRKRGMPPWVWGVVGGGVAALVVAGGIFALVNRGETEKRKDEVRIAQNQSGKPRQRSEKSPEKAVSKEEQPEGDKQGDNAAPPPPALPKTPEPQGAGDTSEMMTRFAVHKETVGPWRIEKDVLVVDHPWGNRMYPNIYFGDKDWRDYDFTVEVNRLARPAHCALLFRHRHTSAGNCYYAGFGKGSKLVTLETARDNRYTGVQREVPLIENDRWYVLRAELRGSRIRIYVDGKLLFDMPEETHPNGCVGLHVNSSKFAFRNIKVTDPDGKVLLQGLPELPGEMSEAKPEIVKDTGKTASPESPKTPAKDDFVPLFNGTDLTGWKSHPSDKAMWKVKEGILIGSGERGHLFSERGDYENFHLRTEAAINEGGSSGMYFRTLFSPGFPKGGYEAQINGTPSDPQKTGSVYGISRVREQLHKPDEWFAQELIVEGDHLIVKVNGKTVVDAHDKRYKKGHFALQQHDPATVVQFRKIEIKELPATAAESSPSRMQDDRPPEANVVAAKAYEKSCSDARTKLLAAFDTVVDKLAKSKGSTEARLKLIEAVKEEKTRFEDKGLIPWSEPMRPFVAKYFAATSAAEIKVRRAYESLIDAQLRAKNESKVADLRADLGNLLGVRVLAKWRFFRDGRGGGICTLYSNGRINNSEGKATWFYAKGVLTFRWPVPQAPGGAWIDTLQVSASGMTYAGTNNAPSGKQPKLTGVYVKDN